MTGTDDQHQTELCTFDLRNLTAINSHEVDASKVQSEDYLLEKASDATQQLIAELWELPLDRSDSTKGGHVVCAMLPNEFKTDLPRTLPPPPPKVETKWDKFAKERGIENRKRDRKVFDEATGEWMYRHGYQKANAKDKEWPIMEVKRNDDPYDDPWEKARESKKTRVDKDMDNRLRNQERAGLIPKGTASKILKNRQTSRESGKHTIKQEKSVLLPSGVPVDIKGDTKRGKDLTKAALVATQRSTASIGKFDKMLVGEPERKAAIRRRQFESGTSKKVTQNEATKGMKILENVLAGGARLEKAKRNGKLAKGETAYDYDYNDGLGDQGYKKKKGRAGVGKLRKMTKKRIT